MFRYQFEQFIIVFIDAILIHKLNLDDIVDTFAFSPSFTWQRIFGQDIKC